jgi:N-acetylglucosamine-6-phosphate deacetylase
MKKQIFLDSDALAPLGLPDGNYPWDDRQITIKNGTARSQTN